MDDQLWGALIQGLFGLGGGLLGAGQPQQRQSFSGTSLDPVSVGTSQLNALKNMGNALAAKAKAGVKLRGVAPSVPGLSVSDPAIKDPSVLNYPGLDLPDNLFGAAGSSGTAVPRRVQTGSSAERQPGATSSDITANQDTSSNNNPIGGAMDAKSVFDFIEKIMNRGKGNQTDNGDTSGRAS